VKLELRDGQEEGDDDPEHGNEGKAQVGKVVPQDVALRPEDGPKIIVEEANLEETGMDPALHDGELLLIGRRLEDQEHADRGQEGDGDKPHERGKLLEGIQEGVEEGPEEGVDGRHRGQFQTL
jgi:hypothetical protein